MRIVFIGTGEIGAPSLRALLESEHEIVGVVTQPDKPVGRSQRIQAPPIKKVALDANLDVLQPAKIKDPAARKSIHDLSPDIIVVAAYGQILPRELLQMPSVACLNLHASLLPRWRGAAPVQAAIAAGDHETGITVMYVAEELDAGDILLQRKIDISPNETGGSLHDRLAQIAPEALLEALELFPNAPRIAQDQRQVTYAPKLRREDGKIDWNQPAETIERKIRAFNPWPGTYTEWDQRKLKIFSATITDFHAPAGKVHLASEDLIVGAADRALRLCEVQLEGKQRMTAGEFLRGQRNLSS